MKVLITGAAGNLGGLLAKHMADGPHRLHLMIHRKRLDAQLAERDNVTVFEADLARPKTLVAPCTGVDCIAHFAGVLFKPRPEKFLPTTNTIWFHNLVDVAIRQNIKRIILISFPHVIGETTPDAPGRETFDGDPVSVHAKTRLEEERYLFEATQRTSTTPVTLRLGMVYGRGILMIDAARWAAERKLLGIWHKPTWIHLISVTDYLRATVAAIEREGIEGIYYLGDDGRQTLQHFLDRATEYWQCSKPWRMPVWMIMSAAWVCETASMLLRTRSPLTRDFIRIGKISYYGDTARMRRELLPELAYPTFEEGIHLL